MDPFASGTDADVMMAALSEAADVPAAPAATETGGDNSRDKRKRADSTNEVEDEPESKRPRATDGPMTAQQTVSSVLDGLGSRVAPHSGVITKTLSSVNNTTELTPSEQLATAFTKTVTHDVALPVGFEQKPREPVETPARVYPFVLDPFQAKSIECLEAGESVLVSAHTSAGKTVVAEYAIAMSLRDNKRVIYTSPIKALSNQKYRDLYEEFNKKEGGSEVGLMTGDVTINPTASCLVMTTEILRSMLYRGSEIMREVGCVIFDEIHYMRDKERGVVWEETIILLPDPVTYVFLSATIPNALEFASWICKLHRQPVNVVYTDYRPTPLQHYVFPAGGEGLYLVVDETGKFREDNFQKAVTSLAPPPTDPNEKRRTKSNVKKKGPSDMYKIIKMIMERRYSPVIVFVFSKKETEGQALQLANLDFNTDEEKQMVEVVFSNAVDSLSVEDRGLPQIAALLPLLQRGIGIHHSGLLPILKEIIEILFQEGLVKVLFATETFSMGLNMPAKTVVFSSVRKFDGSAFRWISGGEYIQMSGRAGRRGLDDRGIVILMVDEKMEPTVAKSMLKGQSDPLLSSFHIGYNMLLNLIRLEDKNPETMLVNSFHQFQNEQAVPELESKVLALAAERATIEVEYENDVSTYYTVRNSLRKLSEKLRAIINRPTNAVPFLQPGRLVRVRDGDTDWGWGIVVNYHKRASKNGPSVDGAGVQFVVDVLLHCAPIDPNARRAKPEPCPPGEEGEMHVVPVLLPLLDGFSSVRLKLHKDLRPVENRQAALAALKETLKRLNPPPLLDPIEHMGITENAKDVVKLMGKIDLLETRLAANASVGAEGFEEALAAYTRRMQIDEEIKALRRTIKESSAMELRDDLRNMMRVLRRLEFTSADDVIAIKGSVAAEINAADELVLTSLLFEGVFNTLSVEQSVALLSTFVFQEKSKDTVKLQEVLAGPLRTLQDTVMRIGKIKQECKIPTDLDEYVASFKPQMMDVVFAWASGSKFGEICEMTDVFEGSIIRAFRRLEELLRQLCNAAKAMGNTDLEVKFAEGITKIKRDIVFAASLYL